MNKLPLRLILADIRSTGNVGSIFRTADACGVELIYTCGYTPYPPMPRDSRPPHIASANAKAIGKAALGAEQSVKHQHVDSIMDVLTDLQHNHYKIAVLEQAENSFPLLKYHPTEPLALILGNEVTGVHPDIQTQADLILELPMIGQKESLNVAVAAGIALYHLRFSNA